MREHGVVSIEPVGKGRRLLLRGCAIVSLMRLAGASAVLLMSETKAKELGYKPLAYLREFVFVAQVGAVKLHGKQHGSCVVQ